MNENEKLLCCLADIDLAITDILKKRYPEHQDDNVKIDDLKKTCIERLAKTKPHANAAKATNATEVTKATKATKAKVETETTTTKEEKISTPLILDASIIDILRPIEENTKIVEILRKICGNSWMIALNENNYQTTEFGAEMHLENEPNSKCAQLIIGRSSKLSTILMFYFIRAINSFTKEYYNPLIAVARPDFRLSQNVLGWVDYKVTKKFNKVFDFYCLDCQDDVWRSNEIKFPCERGKRFIPHYFYLRMKGIDTANTIILIDVMKKIVSFDHVPNITYIIDSITYTLTNVCVKKLYNGQEIEVGTLTLPLSLFDFF